MLLGKYKTKWPNMGKNILHRQKYALTYTYALKGAKIRPTILLENRIKKF